MRGSLDVVVWRLIWVLIVTIFLIPKNSHQEISSDIESWTKAIENRDVIRVLTFLATPIKDSYDGVKKADRLQQLLTSIEEYYEQIVKNESSQVDHVGAFEKLYTFHAESVFLMPPEEATHGYKWFSDRGSRTVTPVSDKSYFYFESAATGFYSVDKGLRELRHFIEDILPVLHDLGHTPGDTLKLKFLAAEFLILAKVQKPAKSMKSTGEAILKFYETWIRE